MVQFAFPGKGKMELESNEAAEKAVKRARSGEGPTLISIDTYRYYGHFEGDPEVYRPKNQVKELLAKGPFIYFSLSVKLSSFNSNSIFPFPWHREPGLFPVYR